MALRNCRACQGRKKFWGAGMMTHYDCQACNGTGREEYDASVQEPVSQHVSYATAEPVVENTRPRAAPKTISVEPIMKTTTTRKKKQKKCTLKTWLLKMAW